MGCGAGSFKGAGKQLSAGAIWLPHTDKQLWDVLNEFKTSPPKNIKDLQQMMSVYSNRISLAGLRKALKTYNEGHLDSETYFMTKTLPVIVENALALKERVEKHFPEGIPLLHVGRKACLRLPRTVAASLLAHMFLCSWDAPMAPMYRHMPANSFAQLLRSSSQAEVSKLRMVIHFFERLGEVEGREHKGFIIIDRVFGVGLNQSGWETSKAPLLPMFLAEKGKGFEDAPGLAHADFANMIIGGGVLANGSIQEEIRFAICPELIATMLLCPRMDDDEAIQIVGAEQFSNYSGYGYSLKYAGDYRDTSYPRAADGTPLISILAMDALDYRYKANSLPKQMDTKLAMRELNKAFAAFTPVDEESLKNFPSIATGNWGCGAFKGDACLKAMLQWAAASQCGRQLRYFPFELTWGHLLNDIQQRLVQKGATVGELMLALWMVRDNIKKYTHGETLFEAVEMVIVIAAAPKEVAKDVVPIEAPVTGVLLP